MALQTKAGSFVLNTGVGNQTITGVGFQPTGILFFAVGSTVEGTSAVNARMSYGMTDGTNDCVSAVRAVDGGTTTDRVQDTSEIINLMNPSTATVDIIVTHVSMNSDGFVINVGTNTNSEAILVKYFAISGTTNLVVGQVLASASPVTGLGFQPNLLLSMNSGQGAGDLTSMHALYNVFGCAERFGGTTRQWRHVGFFGEDDRAQSSSSIQTDGFAGQVYNGSLTWSTSLTTFDTGGFTWAGSNTDQFCYMAIELPTGIEAFAGEFTKSVGGAPATQTLPDSTFTPQSYILCNGHDTSSTTTNPTQQSSLFSIGAYSQTGTPSTFNISVASEIAAGTQADMRADATNVLIETALGGGTVSEAVSQTIADSTPDIIWNPNTAVADHIGYLAFEEDPLSTPINRIFNVRHDISDFVNRAFNVRHDISDFVNRIFNVRHDVVDTIPVNRAFNVRHDIIAFVNRVFNLRHDLAGFVNRVFSVRHVIDLISINLEVGNFDTKVVDVQVGTSATGSSSGDFLIGQRITFTGRERVGRYIQRLSDAFGSTTGTVIAQILKDASGTSETVVATSNETYNIADTVDNQDLLFTFRNYIPENVEYVVCIKISGQDALVAGEHTATDEDVGHLSWRLDSGSWNNITGTDSRCQIWTVVGETNQMLLQENGKPLDLEVDISLVGRIFNIRHDIIQFIGRSFNIRHDIKDIVGRIFNVRHDIKDIVGRAFNVRHDIIQFIGRAFNVRHDISEFINRVFNIRHDILIFVNRAFNVRHDIKEIVNRIFNLRHDLSGAVNRIFNIRHDIAQTTWKIEGITRDFNGSVLANCRVVLFKRDNVAEGSRIYTIQAHTNSNGSGAFSFTGLTDNDSLYMIYSFNDESPDVRGVTDDFLQPEVE